MEPLETKLKVDDVGLDALLLVLGTLYHEVKSRLALLHGRLEALFGCGLRLFLKP